MGLLTPAVAKVHRSNSLVPGHQLADRALNLHVFWTLCENIQCHFLCPRCDATENPQRIHYVLVLTTQ